VPFFSSLVRSFVLLHHTTTLCISYKKAVTNYYFQKFRRFNVLPFAVFMFVYEIIIFLEIIIKNTNNNTFYIIIIEEVKIKFNKIIM
jgi:hypothetical protein